MIPGEYLTSDGIIVANQNKKTIKLKVANTGDRPIQVGSHTHFSDFSQFEHLLVNAFFFRRFEKVAYVLKQSNMCLFKTTFNLVN